VPAAFRGGCDAHGMEGHLLGEGENVLELRPVLSKKKQRP
jgi:hypothetical protein